MWLYSIASLFSLLVLVAARHAMGRSHLEFMGESLGLVIVLFPVPSRNTFRSSRASRLIQNRFDLESFRVFVLSWPLPIGTDSSRTVH